MTFIRTCSNAGLNNDGIHGKSGLYYLSKIRDFKRLMDFIQFGKILKSYLNTLTRVTRATNTRSAKSQDILSNTSHEVRIKFF